MLPAFNTIGKRKTAIHMKMNAAHSLAAIAFDVVELMQNIN